MCIVIKHNKICIKHDTSDSHTVEHTKEIPEIAVKSKSTSNNMTSMDDVYNVDEYPKNWESHISKHEYCALLREQLESVVSSRATGDKKAFKGALLNLIKASMIAYNNTKE